MVHPHIIEFTSESGQMLELELAAVLESKWFCGSRRSCEFLRYLITCALNGRKDLLKERTIGVAVLGRPASYDTGSDASVRVRANDVRRRLTGYYSECSSRQGWRIELAVGSYVPRFVEMAKERATVTFVPGSNPTLVIEGTDANSITTAARLLVEHRQFAQNLKRLTSSSRRGRTAILIPAEPVTS